MHVQCHLFILLVNAYAIASRLRKLLWLMDLKMSSVMQCPIDDVYGTCINKLYCSHVVSLKCSVLCMHTTKIIRKAPFWDILEGEGGCGYRVTKMTPSPHWIAKPYHLYYFEFSSKLTTLSVLPLWFFGILHTVLQNLLSFKITRRCNVSHIRRQIENTKLNFIFYPQMQNALMLLLSRLRMAIL